MAKRCFFKVMLIFIPLFSLISANAIPDTQNEPSKDSGWSSGSTGWGWQPLQPAPIVGLAGLAPVADITSTAGIVEVAPIVTSSPPAPVPSGAPEAPSSPNSPPAPSPGWAPGAPPAPQVGWGSGWKQN